MDQAEFDRVAASFATFHAKFAPLFGRKEAQRRSEQYVRGLLVQQTDRRNAENVAEMIAGATPRTLQRLLTEAPWPTEPVIDHLHGDWVAGDDAYGMVPTLREALDSAGWRYVLDVPQTTPVFTQPAQTVVPPWSGRGRVPTKPRLAPGAPSPHTVQAVAADLDPAAWQELSVAEGAQGPRPYQFAARRVWESRDGLPGGPCVLGL